MTNMHVVDVSSAQPEGSLDPRYVRRLAPDPSGGYTATIHELPGCIAEGDSAEEALSQLELTAASWIEAAEANGYPITPPIDYEGASGKVALRISKRLHQLAAERAELEGVSLNQFIGNALANYLGQQDGMRRIAKQLDSALAQGMHAVYARLYSADMRREQSSTRTIITRTDYMKSASSSNKDLLILSSLDPSIQRTTTHV